MNSKSLISTGLLKSDLKRFWPLWLIYFIVIIILFVVPIHSLMAAISSDFTESGDVMTSVRDVWLYAYSECVPFTFMAAIIVAVSMNERLFSRNAATFYGSLPQNRTTLFATSFLGGFLGLVAVPTVIALALMGLGAFGPYVSASMIGTWLALMIALTFVFYSIAQLACQLSGTRYVAVLLYCVANVLAVCLEGAVKLIVSALRYGQLDWQLSFDWASPLVGILSQGIWNGWELESFSINWMVIAMYCVVALIFTCLALFLETRRDYENAGETVTYAPIRIVLKYLAGISMALLFGAVLCLFVWSDNVNGLSVGMTGAIVLFAALAIGAFLGLVFSEMTMRRTTRIFGKCWRGGIVLTCLSLVLVGCCYTDAFGIESRVPSVEEVESVQLIEDGTDLGTFESQSTIESVTDLHRSVLDYGHLAANSQEPTGTTTVGADGIVEPSQYWGTITFDYKLKSGKSLYRTYPVYCTTSPFSDDPNDKDAAKDDVGQTLLQQAADLGNSEEGLRSRFAEVLDTSEDNKYSYSVHFNSYSGEGEATVALSDEQKIDFITSALTPDILDKHAQDYSPWGWVSEEALDANVQVEDGQDMVVLYFDLDAKRTPNTVAWIKKNFPQHEMEPIDFEG